MVKNEKLNNNNLYQSLITISVISIIWWAVSKSGWINPLFLPKIDLLVKAFRDLFSDSNIYICIFATSLRSIVGLGFSIIIAIPLGLIFGRFPKLYNFFEILVDFFRSIPSSSLFFIFILIFGIGDSSKIAIVVYGCSLILLVNTIYGARPNREKQDRINMLRSFGAKSVQIFYLAVLRDALPQILAGVRVCISLSLVLVIVSEMFLSATIGLGRLIYDFYIAYRIPEMYAVIITLGLLGLMANKCALIFEKHNSFWESN